MLTKRKIFLITGLFLLLFMTIRMVWMMVMLPPEHPPATRGELDLRGWNFTATGALRLDGEWEIYPHTHGMSHAEERPLADAARTFIPVPGNWSPAMSGPGGKAPQGQGCATYRLRILVEPHKGQTYGVRLFNIPSASELYANGSLIARSGQPAENAAQYVAWNVPYSALFTADSGEIELVLQVSNLEQGRNGGILQSISFGTEQVVSRETRFTIILQLMVCTIFVLHAVYAYILYVIGGRQRVLIFFSGAVLFSALRVLVSDNMLLMDWLPFNYGWTVKMQLLSYLGAAVFMLEFTKRLLTKYRSVKLFRWYSALGAVFALYTLLAPVNVLSSAIGGMTGYVLLSFLIVSTITLRTAMKSDNDAIALMLGAAALANHIIWELIKVSGVVEHLYAPVDLVVFFLAFVTYWFKRSIRTFARTEKLSRELQQANKQKDDFLANTSHELRNPLHGILNMTQVILESEKEWMSDKNVNHLELILTVGRRMSAMLNDLIDVTLLKEGNLRLQINRLRIQTVTSGVNDMLRYMLEGKSVRLVNAIPHAFPPVLADEHRDQRQGVGLFNVDRRLKQMYGRGLQLDSVPGQGTTVSFIVPKS